MATAEETMTTVEEIVDTTTDTVCETLSDIVDPVEIFKKAEDILGEWLVLAQTQTGIPAAALLPLIVSLLSIAALVLFQWLWGMMVRALGGGDNTRNHIVLLTGTCGGGKTSLFMTLRSGTPYTTTVTSMAENDAIFSVEGPTKRNGIVRKKVRMIDLPGHPKLVNTVDSYLTSAKAIIIIVDAVDFTLQRRLVAERLRDLLAHPLLQKKKRNFPILVACNKSEKITANPIDFIQKRLEKEIEALRESSGGALQDTAGGGGGVDVGVKGKAFVFADCKFDVTFSAVSVLENDLDELKSFVVVKN